MWGSPAENRSGGLNGKVAIGRASSCCQRWSCTCARSSRRAIPAGSATSTTEWNTATSYGFTGIGAWSVNLFKAGKAFRYP
ncbi:hypothetical protein WME73_37385 [Sorangium sp. So ce302]|uniref:hypothetical protein n=1 Tax=Sorangium sp. So ce302 TaxID=3133297 RepID=UPI003F62B302